MKTKPEVSPVPKHRDYFKSFVAPWVGKFDRVKGKKELTVLVSSDHHSQWLDKFTWQVFLDTAKRVQPDVVVLNGDVVDCHDISRYPKDPTSGKNLQGEVNFVEHGILKPLRAVCPDAQIDWIEGNHEWRLIKYLTEQAPGLAGLKSLEFGSLFHLDKYEVNVVARRGFRRESPRIADVRNYKLYGDRALIVTHGNQGGASPSVSMLRKWGITGISGHCHRPSVASQGNLFECHTWTTTGALCRRELADTYNENPVGWSNGFAYAEISGSRAIVTGVVVNDGFTSVAGKRYFRPGR